jgi:competence protein ComEA
MRSVLKILLGVLAGFMLAGLLLLISRTPTGPSIPLVPAPTKEPLVVQVVGAVPRPGVYEFPEGARVRDAVAAAGGLLTEADMSLINQAAPLEDGQLLEIPSINGTPGTPLAPVSTPVPGTTPIPNADLININTATLEQLDSLPGIGPTTAQKIIDYRTEHGPFTSIDKIMDVSGIGPSTFDKIKNLITV